MRQFLSATSKLTCILLFSACSEAGWQDYGPRGQGFLGSAYGYSDQKVSANSWDVQYIDVTADVARKGAIRRAQEVCVVSGFAGADFSPQVSAVEDLIMASGRANCVRDGQAPSVAARTPASRIQEIDAEIAALRAEQQAAVGAHGALVDPGLVAISGVMNRGRDSEIESRISALLVERSRLASRR